MSPDPDEIRALFAGATVVVPGSVRRRGENLALRILTHERGPLFDVHVHVLGRDLEADHVLVRLEQPGRATDPADVESLGHWVIRDVEPGTWTIGVDTEATTTGDLEEIPEEVGWPEPAVDDVDPRRRMRALDALAREGDGEPVLRDALTDPAPAVRAHALRLMVDGDVGDVTSVLLDALLDHSVPVQVVAASALSSRLRPDHLERALVALCDPAFHAGPELVDALQRSGGVTAALGIAVGIASPSARTRAAALSRLPSVSPRGAGDPGDGAAGPVGWATISVPEPGADDLVVVLHSGANVIIRRTNQRSVIVQLTSDVGGLSALWLGGSAASGWVLTTGPGDALEIPIDLSSRLVVAGILQLGSDEIGRPEWQPAIAATLDLPTAASLVALLEDPALLAPARRMIEGASRGSLAERRVATPRGSMVVDILTGRAEPESGGGPPLEKGVQAALGRLALARVRQQVSGARLWSLDALSAVDEVAALADGAAPPLDLNEVVDALGELPERAIEEGGTRLLHDVIAPLGSRLGDAGGTVLERLGRALALSKDLEEVARDRTRQATTARLDAIGRILVAPDIVAAGIVPRNPVIEDRSTGDVREVSITLDDAVGGFFRSVVRSWPAAGTDATDDQLRELSFHLAGLAATCPFDRLTGTSTQTVLEARAVLERHFLGRPALLPDEPPGPPSLYLGYLDARTPLVAVRMTPRPGRGQQLTLSARIASRPGPLVVALQPTRTHRTGALDNALTFGHLEPEAAAAIMDGLAELGGRDEVALRDATARLRGDARTITPGMVATGAVHGARERAGATVVDALTRATPDTLVHRDGRWARVVDLLDDVQELDAVLAL